MSLGEGPTSALAGFLVAILSVTPFLLTQWRRRKEKEIKGGGRKTNKKEEDDVGRRRIKVSREVSREEKRREEVQLSCPASPPGLVLPGQLMERKEVLLHNISHADLILSLSEDDSVLARPKFSCFRALSRIVQLAVGHQSEQGQPPRLVKYPVHSRDNSLAKRPIRNTSDKIVPVGFGFRELAKSSALMDLDSLDTLRFRQQDKEKLHSGGKHKVMAAYFPLLATLIPRWESYVRERGGVNSEKRLVVFLISGQGTPRDESANVVDNSTDVCAHLMQLFLEIAYPHIEVKHISSPGLNLFRYDENIKFVKQILLPRVEYMRSEIVCQVKEKWKEYMRIYISYASGSSARVSAISASLRPYRPSYMHFWQLKTFWNDNKICTDDIECHTYSEISTTPPIPLSSADSQVQLVVREMMEFKKEWEMMKCSENDMQNFWLRKSKKPVLAVLLVQKGTKQKLYRGTNMEVSMPTGSLCAERNVIGTALADDLSLQRHDLRLIAVLSLSLDQPTSASITSVLHETSINQSNNELQASNLNVRSENIHQTYGASLFEEPQLESEPLQLPPSSPNTYMHSMPVSATLEKSVSEPYSSRKLMTPSSPHRVVKITSLRGVSDSPERCFRKGKALSIQSVPSFSSLHEPPTQHAIVVEDSDMNPLKPCGACHEWLKKFSEVNPSFSVITFTDANFNGIYVDQIES